MSFINIEVNYSDDIMSLHVMIDLQCSNNAGGIAALNSHGKSLTQEQLLIIIIIILLIPQTVKNNNRINDLSVQFACNNYCIVLLYSIIIILMINS